MENDVVGEQDASHLGDDQLMVLTSLVVLSIIVMVTTSQIDIIGQ